MALFGRKAKPAPPPTPPPVPAIASPPPPVFQPNMLDRYSRYRVESLLIDEVNAAFRYATIGQMAAMADLEDLLYASNPIFSGIVDQRIAGLNSVEREVLQGGDSPLAAEMADALRLELKRPDCPFWQLEQDYALMSSKGGGLIEIGWTLDAAGWHFGWFVPVYRQRLRFDRETGKPFLAVSRYDRVGVSVDSYPPGTFIVVQPDVGLPDFGHRGIWRPCIADLFGALLVGGWSLQDIERWITPHIDIATDDPSEKASAPQMIADLGASGGIVHKYTNSTIKVLEKSQASNTTGSMAKQWEDSRRSRWSIRFLGAEQMVAVSGGQGSQDSAGQHAQIRSDLVQGDARAFDADARRDAIVAWAVRNWGPEAAAEAPVLVHKFDESVDVGQELDNFKKADDLGIEIPADAVYAVMKLQRPASVPEGLTLRELRRLNTEPAPPIPSNVVQMQTPGGKR